jgi:ribosomal-protein-alanine N-acetyltransferase
MSAKTTVQIRPMLATDIDRVVEIAAELDQAPQWRRPDYEAALDQSSSPKRAAFIAEISGTGAVVGFAVARLIPPEGELESIAVSTAYQRQGVARRLFESLADELGRFGVREVLLEVRESNRAARSFYMTVGFIENGRRPSYYADPLEDATLMRLHLGPRWIPLR